MKSITVQNVDWWKAFFRSNITSADKQRLVREIEDVIRSNRLKPLL